MSVAHELAHQASKLSELFSIGTDTEILAHADEVLLFLNRLQDFFRQNSKLQISISSINDIIYGLESNPKITLQDKSIRTRLLNLFMKLSLH
jgi:hypothetical protein